MFIPGSYALSVTSKGWVEEKKICRSAHGAQTNLSHCQLTTFTKVLFRFLQRDHNINFINAGCLLWKATANLESVRCSRRCSAVRLLTAYLILTVDDMKPVIQISRISNLNKEEKCCRERVRNITRRFGAFTVVTQRFCTILYFVKVWVQNIKLRREPKDKAFI